MWNKLCFSSIFAFVILNNVSHLFEIKTNTLVVVFSLQIIFTCPFETQYLNKRIKMICKRKSYQCIAYDMKPCLAFCRRFLFCRFCEIVKILYSVLYTSYWVQELQMKYILWHVHVFLFHWNIYNVPVVDQNESQTHEYNV